MQTVCYGFLKLYSEVDPLIPKHFEDPASRMYSYTRNPGHVVQTVRKAPTYVEGEMISIKIAKEVYDLLQKVTPELIRNIDKTMSGFVVWDFIRYSIEYYRAYGLFHYNTDIFHKNQSICHESIYRTFDTFDKSTKILSRDYSYLTDSQKDLKIPRKRLNNIKPVLKPLLSNKTLSRTSSQYISPVKTKHAKTSSVDITKPVKFIEKKFKDYKHYITGKFKSFLIEKVQKPKTKNFHEQKDKKSLLNEFDKLAEDINQEKVSKRWEPDTITKGHSRSFSLSSF
jgi:hypothetical protein